MFSLFLSPAGVLGVGLIYGLRSAVESHPELYFNGYLVYTMPSGQRFTPAVRSRNRRSFSEFDIISSEVVPGAHKAGGVGKLSVNEDRDKGDFVRGEPLLGEHGRCVPNTPLRQRAMTAPILLTPVPRTPDRSHQQLRNRVSATPPSAASAYPTPSPLNTLEGIRLSLLVRGADWVRRFRKADLLAHKDTFFDLLCTKTPETPAASYFLSPGLGTESIDSGSNHGGD